MAHVKITHPAPDGTVTSVVINGVEMASHIEAGGITVQHRKWPALPLVTINVVADELEVVGDMDVTVVPVESRLCSHEAHSIPEVSA